MLGSRWHLVSNATCKQNVVSIQKSHQIAPTTEEPRLCGAAAYHSAALRLGKPFAAFIVCMRSGTS